LIIVFKFNSVGQSRYIEKYSQLVDSLSNVYGIPSCVIFGIAVLESGSGQSKNCKLLNNHFGIVGKNSLLLTHGIKSRYKQYPSDNASFIDFVKVISRKKYYLGLKGNTSCERWVLEISKHGYSEFPEDWRIKVLKVIKKIGL